MVTGIVIPHDSDMPVYEQQFAELTDYQEAVGGYIEPIRLTTAKLTMYANEEGKVHRLPRNRRATALWWLLDPIERALEELVGNVVVIGAPHGTFTSASVPDDLHHLLLGAARFRVEIETVAHPDWRRTEVEFDNYFDAALHALLYADADDAVIDVRVVEQ
ncbi:DUF3846 domain-containing protein [Subtercola frigoramans]|uniref:DUF3846 domain-containing protein n=3 Tax=Subtercola frigoramans TaxID=120298 RepID=A0ABS2L7P9_9MICO|nr:DUF3846 domain-containing protein [Subtercola frigoramans]MBM7472486.1 hypothetical protein [Subtercola frigoramans]